MTAIVGFDISTREITAAIIPLDPDRPLVSGEPVSFEERPLAKTSDDGRRYLEIRTAVKSILGPSPYDVQLAYVERPYSRFAKSIAPMMGVYGAVMASIPRHIARAGIEPQEWRRELGLTPRLAKVDAIDAAQAWCGRYGPLWDTQLITEHMAEALLIALAGRQINNRAWTQGAA